MIAKDSKDIQGLREIGRIVALVRDELARQVRPGITTRSLDEQARDLLTQEGALSAPMTSYDFPGYTCISVNEVACHGVPDDTPLQSGDYVNIDVSASKDGYYADTGMTVIAGEADLKQADMLRVSREALRAGIEAARPGKSTANVGKAIFKTAIANQYTVLRNLTGHGVGTSLHEDPHYIFNYNERRGASILREGQVIAVETFISDGDEWVEENPEGVWPMVTENHSQIVQFEHTVIVSRDGNEILTASDFFGA